MFLPAYPHRNASAARSARRLGLIVFLYVFSHAYFVVGSLKNAFGSGPQEGVTRTFALLFGLGWCALFLGSFFLLLKGRGRPIVLAGAAVVEAVYLIRIAVFRTGLGPDLFGALTTLSMPVYPLALIMAIRRLDGPSEARHGAKVLPEAGVVAGGALVPWTMALVLAWTGVTSGMMPVRPLLALFISLWGALPFVVLVLTALIWPQNSLRTTVLTGGGAATVLASLYGYGLMWVQGNIFLLAVLQTIVFGAQALGIVTALGIRRLRSQ